MLGMGSFETALAIWLTIGLCALCIGYGIAKWNDDGKADKVGPSGE